jgi:hypothetical protein
VKVWNPALMTRSRHLPGAAAGPVRRRGPHIDAVPAEVR